MHQHSPKRLASLVSCENVIVCPLFVLLQVMFVENAFLLLASSWLFSMVSWDTVGIPAAVLCSFLIGDTCIWFFREGLWSWGSFPRFPVVQGKMLCGAARF